MSQEMNESIIAQASLDNLHDILTPEAIGLFPLAPGWWMLLLLLLSILFHFAYQGRVKYKKTAYKRDALHELSFLKAQNSQDPLALLELAKRTGIEGYSREKVATLNDDLWWNFMENESKVKIDLSLRKDLSAFLYHEKALNQSQYQALFTLVETWIQTHKGVQND